MTESLPITQLYLTFILRKKQPIQQSTEHLRNIFKEVPVVTFRRSGTKLRDLRVRVKLANNDSTPKPPVGTLRYNFRHGCLTSPYINHGKHYTLSPTQEKQDKLSITYTYEA